MMSTDCLSDSSNELDTQKWFQQLDSVEQTIQKADNDQKKREAYRDLELLRLDFQQFGAVSDYLKHTSSKDAAEKAQCMAEDEKGPQIGRVMDRFNTLRKSLAVRVPPPSFTYRLSTYLTLVLGVVYSLLFVPVALLLSPLRLLHPTLRVLGVHNDNLPIDLIQKYYARGLLACIGVQTLWEGHGNVNMSQGSVAMFSHGSNLDAFIVSSGPFAFKWIGKKSLFTLPVLGLLFKVWGHIPIDRDNRDKAISSLGSAVHKIHKYKRSIAVSPEGTRSKSGRLTDFKKGPFHIARQVALPISPMLIMGAYELWPPGQVFVNPGTVVVRFLPQINVLPDDTPASLSYRTHRAMLLEYARPLPCYASSASSPSSPSSSASPSASATTIGNRWVNILWLPCTYAVLYVLFGMVKSLF